MQHISLTLGIFWDLALTFLANYLTFTVLYFKFTDFSRFSRSADALRLLYWDVLIKHGMIYLTMKA